MVASVHICLLLLSIFVFVLASHEERTVEHRVPRGLTSTPEGMKVYQGLYYHTHKKELYERRKAKQEKLPAEERESNRLKHNQKLRETAKAKREALAALQTPQLPTASKPAKSREWKDRRNEKSREVRERRSSGPFAGEHYRLESNLKAIARRHKSSDGDGELYRKLASAAETKINSQKLPSQQAYEEVEKVWRKKTGLHSQPSTSRASSSSMPAAIEDLDWQQILRLSSSSGGHGQQ